MNVVHLTSAHPRYDTRIYHKECLSLVKAGYKVHLIVADGLGSVMDQEVNIIDVGCPSGRLDRILNSTARIFDRAIFLDAKVYHLHDPELLPIGIRLKRLGKKVIFDSHEDVAIQILSKPYLNFIIRKLLSTIYSLYERWSCAKLDGIIAATPFIKRKFERLNCNVVEIMNYPLLGEFNNLHFGEKTKMDEVCYVGGITGIRGVSEMIQAIGIAAGETRLNLCGTFSDPAGKNECKELVGWSRVNDLGQLNRVGVADVLARSRAGLVTLHPVANYIDALPVKMFEYMAAGVPVIASNFPLWKSIVESNNCGICVDPLDSSDIASAINYFAQNSALAIKMGLNGRRAVIEFYNWGIEERKLLDFYRLTC